MFTNSSTQCDGLRVAVTGGTSGLGRALVEEFLGRGADVAFVARSRDHVDRLSRSHPRAHGIVGDVSLKEDIHPIAIQIVGDLGGLDVLVNNASDLGAVPLKLLADTDCEELERAIATNVLGPFRHAYATWGAYGASKAALHHLSQIWDAELIAEGIRVLSVDPGDMDTPLHALAVPDADPASLRRPEEAARELAEAIVAALRVETVAP
jgi:NAD(P)-dependent dehydrogenase (short-subunit alcohol dehydrogenase family)